MSQAIRFKVSYNSAASLLSEFTRSVGKGSVTLQGRKPVPLGTRFIFELHAEGVATPVEVVGEVTQITPGLNGTQLLHVRYDPSTDRQGLDQVIRKIFDSQQYEAVREFPRVPVNLRGTEDAPYSPQYVVRDISLGGVGVEVEAEKLPSHIRTGEPFLLEIWLSLGTLALYGQIVWDYSPSGEKSPLLNPAFGAQFGKLRPESLDRLGLIVQLQGLPPPPWRARLSFGMDAISRMP